MINKQVDEQWIERKLNRRTPGCPVGPGGPGPGVDFRFCFKYNIEFLLPFNLVDLKYFYF